jgi:hypothetical protein
MKTNFVLFRDPPSDVDPKNTIFDISKDKILTLDSVYDITRDAYFHITHLPKAGMLSMGNKFFRYEARREGFNLLDYMRTYAVCKTPPTESAPVCRPIRYPGSRIAHYFQVNNFVFVMRKSTDMSFNEIFALPFHERAKLCNLRLEINELIPTITRDDTVDLPPISLSSPQPIPTKVTYSMHDHGYVNLMLQTSVYPKAKKIQTFLQRTAFKRRCIRRKALLAACMASHDRLGSQSSSAFARLMDSGIMSSVIAPMLLPPRKKMRV